jgi:anti-sigma B factor antagonist
VQGVSSDVPTDTMELELAEHGPDARVVTAVGEIDTLSALELAAFLITQLAAARVVVVDLDGVQLLGSAGLVVLFEANQLATQQDCGTGDHRTAGALHLRRQRAERPKELTLTRAALDGGSSLDGGSFR